MVLVPRYVVHELSTGPAAQRVRTQLTPAERSGPTTLHRKEIESCPVSVDDGEAGLLL
jgi:hypothetical protein